MNKRMAISIAGVCALVLIQSLGAFCPLIVFRDESTVGQRLALVPFCITWYRGFDLLVLRPAVKRLRDWGCR